MNDEDDPFRLLSAKEEAFVEADLAERSGSEDHGQTPDLPLPPLPPGAEAIVQQDVDEQLGHEPSDTDDESQRS
jgi:hypothetical protein